MLFGGRCPLLVRALTSPMSGLAAFEARSLIATSTSVRTACATVTMSGRRCGRIGARIREVPALATFETRDVASAVVVLPAAVRSGIPASAAAATGGRFVAATSVGREAVLLKQTIVVVYVACLVMVVLHVDVMPVRITTVAGVWIEL